MWPFLFIIVMIPMIFIWSESARELFPTLAEYLPEKSSSGTLTQPVTNPGMPKDLASGIAPGRWYTTESSDGYVSWAMSADGQYRIAVGCRLESQATIQLTDKLGSAPDANLVLNFGYGAVPLDKGFFTGAGLVNGVAQFKDVYLQNSATQVLAQFTVPPVESNAVARAVAAKCLTDNEAVSQ